MIGVNSLLYGSAMRTLLLYGSAVRTLLLYGSVVRVMGVNSLCILLLYSSAVRVMGVNSLCTVTLRIGGTILLCCEYKLDGTTKRNGPLSSEASGIDVCF